MGLLFRPIRMIFLCGAAFVAGMFYDRAQQADRCEAMGGTWAQAGVCTSGDSDG